MKLTDFWWSVNHNVTLLSPADCVSWIPLFASLVGVFVDVSEDLYASAIMSVHRNLPPRNIHKEAGGGWTGKHRYLICLTDRATVVITHTHTHTHTLSLSLFIKLLTILLVVLATKKTYY